MSVVLGLNAYHADAAACVLVDGRLVAAAEEERFVRVKHWAGLPREATAYCLREAGLRLRDVDHVALNTDPRAQLGRKLLHAVRQRPSRALLRERVRSAHRRAGVLTALAEAFPDESLQARLHPIEHHLAHLASAHHLGPHEDSYAVSVDGFGDFASAAWGRGHGARLRVEGRVAFPHSLGMFYQAMTQYLGFPRYGDEYKVMGLAPYGVARHASVMRDVVRLQADGGFRLGLEYFRHAREALATRWEDGVPTFDRHYSDALVERLGPAREPDAPIESRHQDIAASVQAMYEEALLHLLRALHARHPVATLSLAGGCGMNSVANGKITRETPFERVWIQPAAGDAGGALGAALVVAHRLGDSPEPGQMRHAYWGPSYDPVAIETAVDARRTELERAGCRVRQATDEHALVEDTARRLADGGVVGWFQGRMEWGARALGNRSILGDPRRADMRALLNRKIKRRESFRPFAPSVLAAAAPAWFEVDGDVPFMMKVVPVRPERRTEIPAVTHVDGSARVHTVSPSTNPRFHRLIEAFARVTDVPMLLDTSFNENEPIVCRPEEAIDCFLRTEMDALVCGETILTRESGLARRGT